MMLISTNKSKLHKISSFFLIYLNVYYIIIKNNVFLKNFGGIQDPRLNRGSIFIHMEVIKIEDYYYSIVYVKHNGKFSIYRRFVDGKWEFLKGDNWSTIKNVDELEKLFNQKNIYLPPNVHLLKTNGVSFLY